MCILGGAVGFIFCVDINPGTFRATQFSVFISVATFGNCCALSIEVYWRVLFLQGQAARKWILVAI
jgi:hypothetical protein